MENLSEEELLFLSENPDVFIETIRTMKGREFSLAERPYLRAIYHEFQPGRPRTVIWKSSRKMEKTETIVNLLLNGLLTIDYFNAAYTIARSPQINVFSTERLETAINTSVGNIIGKRLKKPTSVSHKQFITASDQSYFNHLYMYSAWAEAVSLLGLAVDFVVVDETQDMQKAWFPKVKEMLKLSDHKWFLCAGTARDENDDYDKLWQKSTKNEWHVLCDDCNHEQIPDFSNVLGEPGEKYKGCIRCEEPIDMKLGKWKPTCQDIKKAFFVGYHTSQLMHPQIPGSSIYEDWETYESERVFNNEVLGLSYAGGLRPITIDMVLRCTDINRNFTLRSNESGNVFGMDCGKGHHVIIMDKNKNILWMEIIDTTKYRTLAEVLKHVARLLERYNIKNAVIDWGYGQNEVKDLQAEFGSLVKGCRYGTTSIDKWFEYKKRDDDRNPIYRVNVNRSRAVELAITDFERIKLSIPYASQSVNFADNTFKHFTNLTSDLVTRLEGDEYKRIRANEPYTRYGRSGPDHFLHALVYCLLALKMTRKREWVVGTV